MTTVFSHSSNSQTQQNTTAKASSAPNLIMVVQLRGVTKTYANGSLGVYDINLEVKRGEFLLITGPSGAGKSTLLKLLYGAQRPTSGDVIVDQLNVETLRGDSLSRLRRRIGVVFQDYKLIPTRTVSENIAFVLWAQSYTRKEIQRRLLPTLKMVGLQHKANCFPDELSGGEQQRVSLARAIVGTPPLLLADEPTGNLDPDNSRQVLNILKKLNAIGATVIVTTHDENLLQMSNSPIVQLREGRLYRG